MDLFGIKVTTSAQQEQLKQIQQQTTDKAVKQAVDQALKSQSKSMSSQHKKELQETRLLVTQEIAKIHEEMAAKDQHINSLNKNLNQIGIPFADFVTDKKEKTKLSPSPDLKTLEYRASELPNAPQTIEFLIRSIFSHGHDLVLNEGKSENEELKARLKTFLKNTNAGGMDIIDTVSAILRNVFVFGNGYAEKVLTRGTNDSGLKSLSNLYVCSPYLIHAALDETLYKAGIERVKSYSKVQHGAKASEASKAPKIHPNKMVHLKYMDNGGAFGKSPFSKNQEKTRFILHVQDYNDKKFTNEIRHSLWIHLGDSATRADAMAFLAQYRASYQGEKNYGKPLITWGEDSTNIMVKSFDLPDRDFDFESYMLKIGCTHAPSLLNVSPSEIVNNDAKFANAQQGHMTTVLNTIYPWQEEVEKLINSLIADLEFGVDTSRDAQIRTQADTTYKFTLKREQIGTMYDSLKDIVEAVKQGVFSVNDARRILDASLPLVEDEWADRYYRTAGSELRDLESESFLGTDSIEPGLN